MAEMTSEDVLRAVLSESEAIRWVPLYECGPKAFEALMRLEILAQQALYAERRGLNDDSH